MADQVALAAAAHGLDAAPAQPERLSGLGFGRHLDVHFTLERRYLERGAQRGLGKADRHIAIQVPAVATENGMLAHADLHVQIAILPAGRRRLALPRQTDAVAVVDAGRDIDRLRELVITEAAHAASPT